MKFAQRVYFVAGIYGLLTLLPLYLLEARNGVNYPPPITHPEYYYGFLGVAVAWQVAFLFIARDPIALRPMMIPSMIEKASWVIAVFILYGVGRVAFAIVIFAALDCVLGVLFAFAFVKTGPLTS